MGRTDLAHCYFLSDDLIFARTPLGIEIIIFVTFMCYTQK